MPSQEILLAKALKQPLAVVSADYARSSWRVGAVLRVLKRPEILCSQDLDRETLLAKAGTTRGVAEVAFDLETGSSIGEYVQRRRLEAAIFLLQESSMPIADIAELIGFSRHNQLIRCCRRYYGMPPSDIRKSKVSPASESQGMASHAWGLWKLVQGLDRDKKFSVIRARKFESAVLVDLLGEKYLEEGRKCRKRGLEIAELAVESVEASAQELGQLAQELRCLTWARLANARRLVLDFSEADKAFERAEQLWNVPRPRPDKKVEAELLFLKGRLRFEQRRFEEALDLLDLAINRSYRAEAEILLVKSLVQRAEIVGYLDLPDPVIPDLERALNILEKHESETRLRLSLYTGISYAYSSKGDYGKALEVLRGLEKFREVDPLLTPQLAWLRALARIGQDALGEAKDLLYQSREGFGLCQGDVYAAVVSLDLARLSLVQDEISSALRFASEALPVFERYGEYPEVLDILNIFRRALDLDTVTTVVLEKTRDRLIRMRYAPLVARCYTKSKP